MKLLFALSSAILINALIANPAFAQGFPGCVSNTSDPDGDGYGWENNYTCLIDDNTRRDTTGKCEDRGAYPWGWNPVTLESCRLDNITESNIKIDLNGSWDCKKMNYSSRSGWQRVTQSRSYGDDGRRAEYATMNLIFKDDELEIRYERDLTSWEYQRIVKTNWQFDAFSLTVPEVFSSDPVIVLNKPNQYQFALSNDEYFFDNGDPVSDSGSAPNQPVKKMHFYKNTFSRMTCVLFI